MMRRFCVLGLIVVFAVALSACDWPMFRNGPDHRGSSPDTSIGKDAVVGPRPRARLDRDGPSLRGPDLAGRRKRGRLPRHERPAVHLRVRPAGQASCSGVPKVCTPLWIGLGGGSVGASPAVANGVVHTSTVNGTPGVHTFAASGCAASPCYPMWTDVTGGGVDSSPVIAWCPVRRRERS